MDRTWGDWARLAVVLAMLAGVAWLVFSEQAKYDARQAAQAAAQE
jgi:hypothetical protein